MVESNLDTAESDLDGVVESNLENSGFGRICKVRFWKYATNKVAGSDREYNKVESWSKI